MNETVQRVVYNSVCTILSNLAQLPVTVGCVVKIEMFSLLRPELSCPHSLSTVYTVVETCTESNFMGFKSIHH